MVREGFEPASILVGDIGQEPDWWEAKSVVELDLPTPMTVPPTMTAAEAVAIMNECGLEIVVCIASRRGGLVTAGTSSHRYGFDQLPVVDEMMGVVRRDRGLHSISARFTQHLGEVYIASRRG